MDKISAKDLKKQANDIPSKFNLGKNGITDTFIKTVDEYLEAHKIVKIKSSIAANKDELIYYAQQVASKTDSKIVEAKGYTFVLYKE